MKLNKILFSIVLALFLGSWLYGQSNFSTSIHATRAGKNYWYGTANGGYETITNIPITELGCVECHGPTDADGNAFPTDYEPSCVDCHPSNSGFSPDSLSVDQCYSCHGRQKAEAFVHNFTDVHRDAGMVCWDCHTSDEMHGTTTVPNNMFEQLDADCSDCHIDENSTPPLPDHSSYDPGAHSGKIHCLSCHAQSVISCYNCHFESQAQAHLKRAKQQIKNFMLLGNRVKDGKVYPMSFQSISWNGTGWVAFGPYSPHNVTSEGRTCGDCHQAMGAGVAAIEEYNDDGILQFASWNSADSTLSWVQGVVPMPEDYKRSFKIDFIKYDGDVHDPVAASKNWSFVKGDWDGHQMYYITPMTQDQMAKLGFDTTLTSVKPELTGEIPTDYTLSQNYPNPFNPATTIKYSVPELSNVKLTVYNTIGEVVEVLVDREQANGVYTVEFNAKDLSSGIYLYTLKAGSFSETRKMILMK